MEPVVNTVYYLKEVPTSYLDVRVQYVYDFGDDWKAETAEITRIFLITAVDDTNYSKAGFNVDVINAAGEKIATLTAKFSVTQHNGSTFTLDVPNAFPNLKRGYLGSFDSNATLIKANTSFMVMPFWYTLDGVKVSFEAGKTYSFGGGTTVGDFTAP